MLSPGPRRPPQGVAVTAGGRLRRVPPGRAGRLWLAHRLGVASRAAELLDHKARVLRQEAERCELARGAHGRGMDAHLPRRRDVVVARRPRRGPGRPASRHGRRVRDGHGPPRDHDGCRGHSARTSAACLPRRTPWPGRPRRRPPVRTGRLWSPLSSTRRRWRLRAPSRPASRPPVSASCAVTERWTPRLQDALAATVLGLEETERAEGVSLRWALRTARRGDGRR